MKEGKNKKWMAIIAGLIVVSLSSCNMTSKYEKQEKADIQDYLANHSDLNFVLKASGLYYLDSVVGPGDLAAVHDTAHVMYTGYYLNGTKFSTNYGTTDTLVFPVGEHYMITGFDETITYMRVGGQAKILVPSSLAYGSSGYYMPAYTPLLFDIYLVRLDKGPGSKK